MTWVYKGHWILESDKYAHSAYYRERKWTRSKLGTLNNMQCVMTMRSWNTLLGTREPCHVVFKCLGQDGRWSFTWAHKERLAASSEVFKRMFYGPLKEKSACVVIPDIDALTFTDMLQ